MFQNAVQRVSGFTRPMHLIHRFYNNQLGSGAATLFFVNETGDAITCKHVAALITNADQINNRFQQYKQQLVEGSTKVQAAKTFGYTANSIVQWRNNFLNCFDQFSKITIHAHPMHDLAIVRFQGFNKVLYHGVAEFGKNSQNIQPGKFFCRLGFPFPEFNNFSLNLATDNIEWNQQGIINSPSFPTEGMCTRLIGNPVNHEIMGIELSTPGFKGQSGGPLFDENGKVFGMQFATRHLHLGFDIHELEVSDGAGKKMVSNNPFLHVGMALHLDVIKQFLNSYQVKYYEAD